MSEVQTLVQAVKEVGLMAVLILGILLLCWYLVKEVLQDHRQERAIWMKEQEQWDNILNQNNEKWDRLLAQRHEQLTRAIEYQRQEHNAFNAQITEARREHMEMIALLGKINGGKQD